jgi:hypothetical protein
MRLGLGLGLGGTNRRPIAPSFPATQAGLLAWGRADDPNIVLVSGNVKTWPDKTGHGNDMVQNTTANQPSFLASSSLNGQPAVRMSQSGSKLVLGTFTTQFTGSAITIIMIGVTTFGGVNGGIVSAYTTGASDFDNLGSTCLTQLTATSYSPTRNNSHVSPTIPSTASGLAGVYSLRYDGTTGGYARLNGTDGNVLAVSGAFALNNFIFGARRSGAVFADYQNPQDVCEWAIIDHALSPTEWAAWSAYTTARYGVAA